MYTECFELVSFDFVVGIGVFLNIYLIADTIKLISGSKCRKQISKFNNTVDIKLG